MSSFLRRLRQGLQFSKDDRCAQHTAHPRNEVTAMQLDPQMKALLDQIAALGGKPFHFGTPEEARAGINALIGMVAGPPEHVAKVEDRKIPGPGGEIPVRIYTPAGAVPMGALLYF